MMKKAIFFDRDGVVNYRKVGEYVHHTGEFVLLPDFLDIFPMVHEAGYLTVLVTNQQGIGKGIMDEDDLSDVHEFLQNDLKERFGYNFDDIYYCPELADTNSFCRKPNPGMLVHAIEKWHIDPKQSWMIGDSISDVIAGRKADCNTVLLGRFSEEIEEADYIFLTQQEIIELFREKGLIK
jgi:D-glycero-D-manno-heptose 1,7-bisphosphate phosphatase